MLALIAAALAPLILVSFILPALSGQGATEDRDRIESQSVAVSASLSGEIERIRSTLLLVASDRSVIDVLSKRTRTPTAGSPLALLPLIGSEVVGATIVDRTGASAWPIGKNGKIGTLRPAGTDEAAAAGAGAALGPGEVMLAPVNAGTTGASDALLVVPVSAVDGTKLGVLRLELDLAAVLETAGTGPSGPGYALIVDAGSGAIIADSRTSTPTPASNNDRGPSLESFVGEVVQRADRAWSSVVDGGWTVGLAPLVTQSAGGLHWSVVIAEPRQGGSGPLGLLGALGALTLLLLALALWMSNRVLGPARELESSREELKRLYESARVEALLDPLTGIGNQRAFSEEFDRELERTRRHASPAALVLLDLDNFKDVNDRLGHPAGDTVLMDFAEQVRSVLRVTDRAFRLGGDEFALILPSTGSDGAEIVARRLLMRALELPAGGQGKTSISFSAGIAAAPDHGTIRSELYARADAALYSAKRHGRTGVEVFEPSRHRISASLGGELSGAVLDVIARRALKVLFQPIVGLADGEIIGFEALSRPSTAESFPGADSFFSAAAMSGRVLEADAACLEMVLASAHRVPGSLLLTINLSPATIEAPEFNAGAFVRGLGRAGISPHRVAVELTEREPIDDVDRVRQKVEALQAAGVRVAADDVGAGNNGLQLLSKIRFDIVKIDLSLVHDASQRRRSLEVMRSLVAIAHNGGALVVAEGVETAHQLETVRELGVDAVQGYLVGRPLETIDPSPVDIEALLAAAAWATRGGLVRASGAA